MSPHADPAQAYRKDPYSENLLRQNHVMKQPAVGHPGQRPDRELALSYEPQAPYGEKLASREFEPPTSRYDSSGYTDPCQRGYEHRLRYEEQWPYFDDRQPHQHRPPFDAQHPRDLDPRPHPDEPSDRGYFPHFEEPTSLPFDSRARFDQPPRTSTLRHEESLPSGYELPSRYRPEAQTYAAVGPKGLEPKPSLEQYPRSYEQVPTQGLPSKPGHYEPAPAAVPSSTKPLPPLPPAAADDDEDPAMKPQSVLNRVRMFENKRSASLEHRKDENHLASLKPAEAASRPSGAPVTAPKAALQNQLSDHDKTLSSHGRMAEPQKPQAKPPEDIVRANHYDPEEDEEYYRKQLSYFDRRSFDSKPALVPTGQASEPAKSTHLQTQPSFPTHSAKGKSPEADAIERSFGEKRPEPLQPLQPTPPPPPLPLQYTQPSSALAFHSHSKGAHGEGSAGSLDFQNSLVSKPDPPPLQNKPATFRAPSRDEAAPPPFYSQKSFSDKVPVNGAEPAQKTPAYNRFTAKPYTSAARPFERKFESPKFNHNLLPTDTAHKPDLPSKAVPQTLGKPASSVQPLEFDSGVETFSLHAEKPKYQLNNISAMPKAVPVSPSAVEEDEDEDGHTVVATARGVFNSNGGVLSSIETGVSIIIPQGAVPEGVEQEIYFKVCRDNSLLPPLDKEKGETLLSPLVMCGPHGLKFLKPVELRLPHCASMTPDGDPKTWQNKCLPGDPNYLVGANCVSVLIDHF